MAVGSRWVLANVYVTPNLCSKSPQVSITYQGRIPSSWKHRKATGGNGEGTGTDEGRPAFLITKGDQSRGT